MSVFDGLKFRKVYSPIHNLDPRIKFVYVIAIFVVAILFDQIIPLLDFVPYADSVCFVGTGSEAVATFAARRSFLGSIHLFH